MVIPFLYPNDNKSSIHPCIKGKGVSNMKYAKIGGVVFVIGLIIFLVVFFSTQNSTATQIKPFDPAFYGYISAYTTNVISRDSSIIIELSYPAIEEDQIGSLIEEDVFEFEPEITGSAIWVDRRTLQFQPEETLPSGQFYAAEFHLDEIMDVPDNVSTFYFQFQVKYQSFNVEVDSIKSEGADYSEQVLTGTVYTNDTAEIEELQQVLDANQDGDDLNIEWTAVSEDQTAFTFTIDNIERKNEKSTVNLLWDGEPLDIDYSKGELDINIPTKDEFAIMNVSVNQDPQYIRVQFSDPLKSDQDLSGLVRLSITTYIDIHIEDNEILIYPRYHREGETNLILESGIKSRSGSVLGETYQRTLRFSDMKPAVQFTGEGTILPKSGELPVTFQAVNLKELDMLVVKIFENNIPQFLQVNDYDGNQEIRRVGNIVARQTISLESLTSTNLSRWNTFSINLSDYITPEPGAIYQITLAFDKDQSIYPCGEGEPDSIVNVLDIETYEEDWDEYAEEGESSYWDYWDEYSYGGWYNRDDPCHQNYYNSDRWSTKNILASNLGIIAKKGEDRKIQTVVTDLLNTDPVSGAQITVYDYQNQVIGRGETDNDGLSTFTINGNPYLLMAQSGEDYGYLKMDDGNSLSISTFDVGGSDVKDGLKGFIYGERGVWRPGDNIYLTFVLKDDNNTIPEDHPVVFEFYNPQNTLIHTLVRTESIGNFYSFHVQTDSDAPTGNYQAVVKVGGAVFRKTIKVETVKPNRLKIYLDFGTDAIKKGQDISGELRARWLHGATARNLDAEVNLILTEKTTEFTRYSDYIFDDPARSISSEEYTVFDGSLNENGIATVEPEINIERAAPGLLNAHFTTRVFETGGDFSIDRFTIPYYPYEVFTGIHLPPGDAARGMLLTDENHTVDIVSVDSEGNPTRGNREVEVSLYKVEWRWWWDTGEENLTNYNSSSSTTPLQRQTITTRNGEGNWTLRVNYPDWGRYLIRACDEESGHCTGKAFYMDWPGWAGRPQDEQPGGASMLTFSTDKSNYTVGEEVTVSVPTGESGRLLCSLENGTGIVSSIWKNVSGDETTEITFETTPQMSPNVYVHVTLLQPHSQTANDLPIRLYGIIPIIVEDSETRLQPVITTDEVFRPETTVNISVKEATGEPMVYTLAVVDEGILGLTRFQTPNPRDTFYAREALGVKTWDIYDNVIGVYSMELEPLLSIGGGADDAEEPNKEVMRFEPMVRFLGPFQLEENDSNSHSVDIPQYIGEVRVMVVAGSDQAYGAAEKAVPVRTPLMVLGTLPRVLGPLEEVKLPVTVFAMEPGINRVNIDVEASDILNISGSHSQTLSFSEPGDKTIYFDMTVDENIGQARVEINASAADKTSQQVINIEVRNPNPRVTDTVNAEIEPENEWKYKFAAVGVEGTNEGVLEFSRIPPLNLGERLRYLIHYPYGCIEQTTSSGFPQVYLPQLMDLSDNQVAEVQHNVRSTIQRILTFQNQNGGIAYWPGNNETDDWSTNYAGHFMLEAKNAGYLVPQGFINQWKRYQRTRAISWEDEGERNDLIQSYRLYTLALADAPEMGAMNRLREKRGISKEARWRLAAAYQVSGMPEIAMDLAEDLNYQVVAYKELGNTYGSDLRDKAMILEALSLMDQRQKASDLMREVSQQLSSQTWYSTQSTAYALVAMAKYVGSFVEDDEMTVEYSLDGDTFEDYETDNPVAQVEIPLITENDNLIKVRNTSNGIVFTRLILSGIPAVGDETSASNNLSIQVKYLQTGGEILNPVELTQGTDFIVEVSITHPGQRDEYKNMVLHQVFPSGWEIINTRMSEVPSISGNSDFEYQDIRDDRVYTFFDLPAGDTYTYRVMLNAAYIGRYYAPAVYCQAMYDNSISAREAGGWVEIQND